MGKSVFKKFLRDRVVLILFYLFNMVSVVAFFHLSEPANTEVWYPLSIGGFLLAVYLVVDWFRYYQPNQALEEMIQNQPAEFQPHTEEQKSFQHWIQKTEREHSSAVNDLKEQNKERLYFLSHWMHHLKTPVSVMELMIQNELQTQDNPGVLEKVQFENRRLHNSIEQGLTMIRMDSFENDLEVQGVDLLSSLRKIINSRKSELIYHSIFPTIECEEEATSIITDPKWNEVMLEQVISNAIKYSSLKSGTKKLRLVVEKVGTDTLLSIIDEGAGIPPYDVERVFESFFTGENGRTFRNSSGIGLYLCRKIADKLNHTISIESEVTKGTAVTIRYLTKL
ncbi:signal transduction histidine kinase [Bacillus tianshenii]|uniref:histidine kinase n=1 Tax=Sutcliffiella tianshenii TaxID=1463404 RepID=A0ABS2P5T2_9BACI|nr:sensor histidine kinase [Bacillus tianshenii]MBM7621943.1 signal transduction histidine kinase [Bacillus tianshenii]